MTELYCHLHSPVCIEEKNDSIFPPIVLSNTIYILNEKVFLDLMNSIGYLQNFIQFSREQGNDYIEKWLYKKNLLNEEFLEGTSKYWIENTSTNNTLTSYKAFQKNNENKPIMSENYLKDIFKNTILYSSIKNQKEKFNEFINKELNIIESEINGIKDEKKVKTRQNHFKNNIFKYLIENFNSGVHYKNNFRVHEIDNISLSSESLLTWHDLFAYKISGLSDYKNGKFNCLETSFRECLRENTFIKINADCISLTTDERYMKSILKEILFHSKDFAIDSLDFGVKQLKKLTKCTETKRKLQKEKKFSPYQINEVNNNIALLKNNIKLTEATEEEHLIAQYNSLKNYATVYFAPESELTKYIVVLNLFDENLEKLNNLIWGKNYRIESELVKFTFKKSNYPYSAYGYASIELC